MGPVEKRDERKEKLIMDEKEKEEALSPYDDSYFMGDLPSEIDLWQMDAIDFDELTKEGKDIARKIMAQMNKEYEDWKRKEGKK